MVLCDVRWSDAKDWSYGDCKNYTDVLDTPDCTENSLKTHISHLRGKLREISGKEYVESVWGIGFRWKLGFDGENANE